MDPVPVVGMLADHRLERVRVSLRVFADGGLAVAPLLGIESGQDRYLVANVSPCRTMNTGITGAPVAIDSRAMPSLVDAGIPKIHEDALAHVEVESDRDHPVLPQHPHHLAPARLALDDAVAVAHALGADGGVDERIAQRAMDDARR